MTLYDSVNNVLKRLDDYPAINGEQVWTRAEVELYLTDGYNAFCRQTKCLLDFFYPENIPPVGNYTARWELGYYQSGMIAHGILSYSGGLWERDYSQASGTGPINHTQPWEADYIETIFPAAVHAVPEDNVAVDRATFDLHQLEPEFTRFFEETDRSFQTVTGDPWRFAMDRDGISRLRLVPAGSGNATTATINGSYGLLRQPEGLSEDITDCDVYYSLDETSGDRLDGIGSIDLTPVGSTAYNDGKVGNAAEFNGTTDYLVKTANGTELYPQDSFTFAFWIYPTAVATVYPTPEPKTILAKASASSTDRPYELWWYPGYNLVRGRVTASDGSGTSSVDATGVLPNVWTHIVWSYDRQTKKVSIWKNGALFNTASTAVAVDPVSTGTAAFSIGATFASGNAALFYEGMIDEVRFWNRPLTTALATELYEYDDGAPDGTLFGTWGALREIPEHFPMGAQYGIPRRMYFDTANTRVEYFRLGKDWEENGSELPSRFLKFAEFYAQAKCLERDGPGQELKLSGHFMARFNTGVSRMVKRLGENKRAVVGQIGSPGRAPTVPPLARLPWRYGRQIRRGY